MMRLPQLLHRNFVMNFSLPSQNEPWGGGAGGRAWRQFAFSLTCWAEDNLELTLGLWLTDGRDMD